MYVILSPPTPKSEGGFIYPPIIPSFLGSKKKLIGMGIKKKPSRKVKKGYGLLTGHFGLPQSKTWNSITVLGQLSNFGLLNFFKHLKIKYFKGIFSKDNLPNLITKECEIINLDDQIGVGTHWIAYRNTDKYCKYFDSFGLKMPTDVHRYLLTSDKQLVYSKDEIQERGSVFCGYRCLYYLLERQRGRSIVERIHNPKFSFSDQSVNHRFIITYFKNMYTICVMVKRYCVNTHTHTHKRPNMFQVANDMTEPKMVS